MKIFKLAIILLLPLMVCSCTKVIDLDLKDETGKLVIEGNITNLRERQYVKLSRNVPFSSTNNYPAVTGATVTVTDQIGNNFAFTEESPGVYSFRRLTGISGRNYTLTVVSNSKTYTANSVMPRPVYLDSLTAKDDVFSDSRRKKIISAYFLDPEGVPNQYRFVMYVNNIQVKTVYAYDDNFNDGRYITIDLRSDDNDDDAGIYAGDTVRVDMQCLDKPVYTYWYTLMQQGNNGPGGGVTPSDPPGNITPSALGYFSAHTTQTRTFVVE